MAIEKPETDLDLFARIVEGEIVEFPVYRVHIRNRAHPISWYVPVVELPKPELPAFCYYNRSLVVKETYVEASFTVASFNLGELLTQLKRGVGVNPGADLENILITDVEPATIQRVYILGGEYITNLLSAFAQTRFYDSIGNLTDYRDSSFPKFQVEGMRGFVLRDRMWQAMITFFTGVVTGVIPVPTSIAEVDAILPELTWEDEVPAEGSAPVVGDAPVAGASGDSSSTVVPEVDPSLDGADASTPFVTPDPNAVVPPVEPPVEPPAEPVV